MKLKTFFFFLFIAFMNVLYSQGREGRSLSDEARDPFPERKEHKENNKEEKKTRTIVINSARTTEYKKIKGRYYCISQIMFASFQGPHFIV